MSHGGHAHADASNPTSKYIGLTMALLGVLLALCSALVGSSRTELIATMVEQTNTSLRYQAVATKHRTLLAQLQQLHALMPLDPLAFKKQQDAIKSLVTSHANGPLSPALAEVQLTGEMILNTVVPTAADVKRFVAIVKQYDAQRDAAHEWAESYEDAIRAHSLAAEHFEWAQLAAEIGIVIASIALLLANRRAWLVSLLLAAASVAFIAWTLTAKHRILAAAEAKIHDARVRYEATIDERSERAADERLLADIEAAIPPEARAAAAAPGAPRTAD